MRPTIFIQANAKQALGAKVAAHALKRSSNAPGSFDVQLMRLEDQKALVSRSGQHYLREGRQVPWRNDDLQSFTPLRFLPPSLLGFRGRALVIDPDVFALADVNELLSADMGGKSVLCRRIEPADGKTPYWATSVMLLDCEKLAHWSWTDSIEEMFSSRLDYRDWMSLALEDQTTIGCLTEQWNHYDQLNSDTKMLHNTRRLTQPWKTGLPVDFVTNKTPRRRPRWVEVPRNWARRALCALRGTGYLPEGFYQPHPDRLQERLFFDLLAECLEQGTVTESELRLEMAASHVRRDAFDMLRAA